MIRRISRLVLGVAAVLVLLGVAGTGEQGAISPMLLVLLVGGLGWLGWWFVQRRRPIVPTGWAPAAPVTFQPAAAQPPRGAVATSLALARVEVRELTGSAAFGVGLGFCGLALFLFGRLWVADFGGDLPSIFELLPILAHPLAGMVVLASFRARTRGRRDGVEELFATCPASPATRTLGHLLTGWATAITALAFSAAMTALILWGSPTPFGEIGARQVAAFLGTAVLCAGATALGVALARWTPWTLVPIVAVVAVGFLSVDLATRGTRTTEPVRQLSTWLSDPEIDLRFTAPHWVAHHLWIVGLTAVVAVLALLRDHRGRAVIGAGLAAAGLTVASGVAATRPIDAEDAQRIAALVDQPRQEPCVDAGGLAICTFDGDDELADALAGAVAPVAAAAPPGALDGWTVQQWASTDPRHLDPEVLALVGDVPRGDAHLLPIEFTGHPLALEGLRLWAGLAATGALDSWVPGTTLRIRGQARGVIALWLATRGADPEVQRDLTSLGTPDRTTRDRSRPWPDTCFAGLAPVRWATTDVVAARRLLDLPDAEVRGVLLAEWDRLTDRKTTADDLLAAVDLDPLGVDGETGVAEESGVDGETGVAEEC